MPRNTEMTIGVQQPANNSLGCREMAPTPLPHEATFQRSKLAGCCVCRRRF